MDAPIIGLTTYRQVASWGAWNAQADLLPTEYAAALEAAGGIPVLLPPVGRPESAERVVSRLDALVITGGSDVEPNRYGAQPHPHTSGWNSERDAWELALLDAANEAELAVLGICRGMQLMAVHAGGTLDQHTPDLVGHETHNPGGDAYGAIEVETLAGSRIATLVGDHVQVNCHHHQSVATHPGFVGVAHAADGILEAMEAPGERFLLGVQWHPESRLEVGLMTGLVHAARANAHR